MPKSHEKAYKYQYEAVKDAEEGISGYQDEHDGDTTATSPYHRRPLVVIPFRHFIRVTVLLPLAIFLFNIFYVLCVDFYKATTTLCFDHRLIPNYLPSFSAVIGLFPLPSTLWNLSIALTSAPRFLCNAMTYSSLDSVIFPQYKRLNFILLGLGSVEILGLILLTFVSSRSNFPVHMWSFVSFLIGSEGYMLLWCILMEKFRSIPLSTSNERKSLRMKWRLTVVNIGSAVGSVIVYYRHSTYCEPGVYSLFAFLEYIVVLSNMGFHLSTYWDFYDRNLVI